MYGPTRSISKVLAENHANFSGTSRGSADIDPDDASIFARFGLVPQSCTAFCYFPGSVPRWSIQLCFGMVMFTPENLKPSEA